MSDHLQNKPIKVSGHLEDKRGIYQMALSWIAPNGKRVRRSKSTGLGVKGNKKRAEEMLRDACKEQEKALTETKETEDILFADFMELWLEVVRNDLKPTTFGGYQNNVERIIAPYFREKGILLKDLTSADINEFYETRLKKVKPKTVIEYHNRINSAIKYAIRNKMITHSPMEMVKRPKAERYVAKHLSETETIAIFDAAQENKIEFPIILGAFYGLRREDG